MASLILILLSFFLLPSLLKPAAALDQVPESNQFRFVNEGEFVDTIAEFDATYRAVPNVVGSPFQLTLYNTTPNAYKLALRMGTPRSGSIRRWVWEANRSRPVKENATLTFAADGNLVLSDANGAVVWSSGTANKGVVGVKILHSGNMVLYNKKGNYLWQSFDFPTDTLLVGQSLSGGKRLVSRRSESDGSPGIYSLQMKSGEPILYVSAASGPLVYFNNSRSEAIFGPQNALPGTFTCRSEENVTYDLAFGYRLVATKYDSTLSFLRLNPNGDLIAYTYDDRVEFDAWERTFSLFDPESTSLDACFRPSKCLSLGICEEEQCVACPAKSGTTGWSASCGTKRICKPGLRTSYIKVAGVEHFLTRYSDGEGKRSLAECKRRCDVDCTCSGFLFWEESSRCWLAPILGPLNKVKNARHVAYVKSS